jgi:hypothetical protein
MKYKKDRNRTCFEAQCASIGATVFLESLLEDPLPFVEACLVVPIIGWHLVGIARDIKSPIQ